MSNEHIQEQIDELTADWNELVLEQTDLLGVKLLTTAEKQEFYKRYQCRIEAIKAKLAQLKGERDE